MADSATIQFVKSLSRLLGWIYTLAWSLSFYPQPLLNYRRRSTKGALIDFPAINFLSFTFYFMSTILLFANPVVRSQYASRHPKNPEPTVRANDVAFAAHALLLTGITISQWSESLWGFEQKKGQKPQRYITGVAIGCILGTVYVIGIVLNNGGYNPSKWAWIDIVYTFGYCKLIITVVKYVPQVWANYQRKSTVGWSIGQIICDLVGGVLSVAQIMIDSALEGSYSGITGNPVKFYLGNVSVIFDIIFIVQHYILYGQPEEEDEASERRGLLVNSAPSE